MLASPLPQALFARLRDLVRQSSAQKTEFRIVDFYGMGGKDIWKGPPSGDTFPTPLGEGGTCTLSLPSSSRARGIPPGFSELCPTSVLLQPNPQGLRAERTHHPGQKPPKDPPLPSSRLDSGRGEAGPEMSLSPSGREGLLSSCPTGGGQGRSLMTLMSTGASSSKEKRDRDRDRGRD